MSFVAAGATDCGKGNACRADGAFVDGVAAMGGEKTLLFCLAHSPRSDLDVHSEGKSKWTVFKGCMYRFY